MTDLRPLPGRQFEPGNTASVTSGAFSPRIRAERAAAVRLELEALLEQDDPWWITRLDSAAVDNFAAAVARRNLLRSWIETRLDETGGDVERIRPYLWTELDRADRAAREATAELGLSPPARARILRDLAQVRNPGSADIRTLGRQGRKLRELRRR